jgi:acetylornithine deacetylase/succinyl-diaminopimelate desuccinylase-like protein
MLSPKHLSHLLAEVDRRTDEQIRLLQDLVRIESVSTGPAAVGNETQVGRALQAWLASHRIQARLIESAPRRGNLIVALGNPDAGPRLMWMAHADVVSAENPNAWSHPPFGGEIHAGKVWGRGTLDCKGLAACEALALTILNEAGLEFRGELRLVMVADEETGCTWGTRWLTENMPELVRADYVLNEGPGLPMPTPSGYAYLFPIGAKGSVTTVITVHGREFHASQPWRADSAIVKMSEVVRRLALYEPPRDVSLPVFKFLDRLSGITEPVTIENIDALVARIALQNRALADRLHGLSRSSYAATVIRGGTDEGIIPGACELVVKACLLPGQDLATVEQTLRDLFRDLPGIDICCNLVAEPSLSPPDTPFAEQIRRAACLANNREDIYFAPIIMNGAGDTRYLRPLGALAYDFWPLHPQGDMESYRTHCVDECVEIETLVTSTKLLIALACLVLDAQPTLRGE